MALQFILGASGSGKSTELYARIRAEAAAHPDTQYLLLVPDQFTLETQRTLVEQNGGKGILNIDVLSFHRLAYRAFEEVPALRKTVLEDMGKMMLLRKVFTEQKKNLVYFKRGLYRTGFLDECKSFLCELAQYAIEDEDFDTMLSAVGEDSLMGLKLIDLRLIYQKFQEKLGDTYMMAEELVPQLTGVVKSLRMMKKSVICLDGFTGFTPTQYELLSELLSGCIHMYVTVTVDTTEKRGNVFAISLETIRRLTKRAGERGVSVAAPIWTGKGDGHVPYRVADNAELAFLEKNLFSFGGASWLSEPENVSVVLCRKEWDEAAYVARSIWWLVREEGYQYEDFAVVTANIASYEQELSKEMQRFDIPYFMDYKKSIGANAMAEFIMAFCNMVEKGMDYESTFRFLRCGLSPLTKKQTDLLENYVLAQGRRGLAAYQQEWQYNVRHLDLVEINEYRLLFLRAVEETLLELKGGKKTVREFTEILYRLLIKNNVYDRLREKSEQFERDGQAIFAREYRSIYRLMMNLLDELVELLGAETVSFQEYAELLGAGISEGLVGFIPPTSHQVVVGDVRRTRLKDVKVLFFLGVNDDCIPKSKGAPGILSETERRKLAEAGIQLSDDAEKESYTEQFYLYLALTKASDKVILTYSAMSADGTSKRPAYLIDKVKNLYPGLKVQWEEDEHSVKKILGSDSGKSYLIRHLADGTYMNDDAWWEIAVFYEKKKPGILRKWLAIRQDSKGKTPLRIEAAQHLYGTILDGSVTRLEQFVKCPYAHFIRYGLRLEERAQFEISGLDHGNIFHKSLEHFSHELEKMGKTWQDLTEGEAGELAEHSIDYATERYEGKKYFQSKRTEFMMRRLKNELRNSVWAMWRQMKAGDFYQFYTEKYFSGWGDDGLAALRIPLSNGNEINLRGVIDRVDVSSTDGGELVKIVDYKSSDSVELSLAQVYHGLQMQLVTYMAATKELLQRERPGREIIPAAMLYYAIKEKNLEWKRETEEQHEERLLESMQSKGYVNVTPEVRERLDGEYPNMLSTKQFDWLMQHTREKMAECGEKIMAGEMEAAPYIYGNHSGCDYCDYRGICGMDLEEQHTHSRVFEELQEEEIWEVLHERHKVDSGTEENYRDEKL